MGKALYRTYRSKKLSEIVGQEHITTALENALKTGNICHAYLFTGPRGVGKTSIARILAHEINGLPYEDDSQHLDIIEIDAASNRRIDEIRDLRDKVHIAPTSAKYKVYIIDEVHMLTKEAFNALLKTLEEPPAHVIFILATTEVHKLPETIISRTQRYAFKPVDLQKVVDHLKHIAQQEKITISDDALQLIAAHGEGSFRDSISLLDQVRNTSSKVELGDVQEMLGIAPAELVDGIVVALGAHDAVTVAAGVATLQNQGYEPAQVARQLGQALRAQLVQGNCALEHEIAIRLLSQLVQVPASPDPRVTLEIALLDAAMAGQGVAGATAATTPPASKVMHEEIQATSVLEVKKPRQAAAEAREITPVKEPVREKATDESNASISADNELLLDEKSWDMILGALKKKHNTLYSVVRMAQPHFEPGKVTLEFGKPFYQKRINEAHNKQLLVEVINGVIGSILQVTCVLGEGRAVTPEPPALPPADAEVVMTAAPDLAASAKEPTAVDTISNIFGGAELLES